MPWHRGGRIDTSERSPLASSNHWDAGLRHRLRRIPTSVRLTILSPPRSRTNYGPQAHVVFGDGRSSGSYPISFNETASWQQSPLIIWTPTSSMPLSDGVAYHCDQRRFPCGVGSATAKPEAGCDQAWRRRSSHLASI